MTSFVLDDLHEYEVWRAGKPIDRFSLHVKIASDGTYYFETERGRLYFGKYDGTFYVYRVDGDDPYLRQLFLALPRLPLAYKPRLAWCDFVPLRVATSGIRRSLAGLAHSAPRNSSTANGGARKSDGRRLARSSRPQRKTNIVGITPFVRSGA